jgi:hypothetical protein
MANIVIDIAAEFTGKNAFKSAETSTDRLNRSAKNLGKTLGLTFSGAAVLAYAKKSIKAAAEDQAAQASLAQTLKNLGLETGNTAEAVNGFISNLERQTGILDDELRPAMDRLLRATGSVSESQKLLGLALDISAGTGKDLTQVTQGLQKAFLGNVQGLGRLGVGLTKAELKTGNFADITQKLTDLFAGQAERQADSFKGSIDKLAVAANNASEIIGTGLIAALQGLGEDESINSLTTDIEDFATEISKSIQAIGLLLGLLKSVPDLLAKTGGPLFELPKGLTGAIFDLEKLFQFTGVGALSGIFDFLNKGAAGDSTAAGLAHLAELEAKYAKSALEGGKKLTAEELKQLKAKQLKLAIDKANLALGKGSNVFDMEKIQLAAAEKNAAEQLGKVTSQAQLLQITNDLARLQVKESILALEEAIASKDVDAITAATNKLNADLKIIGALTGQEMKLKDIESILKGILPKDLINLANLNEAIRLLGLISGGGGGGMATHAAPILGDPNASPKGFPTKQPMTPAEINAALIKGSFVPVGDGAGGGGSYASSGFPGSDKGYPATSGGNTIIVNTGIGDPNAIAEAIDQVLQDAVSRGTLRVA